MNDDSVAPQVGAGSVTGPAEPGYYPDPMGYFQFRFYDPIHGWSAPCIHNGRRIQDPLEDVSKPPPPTTSPLAVNHELTETWEEPAMLSDNRVADATPAPDLYWLPVTSETTGNATPDGGPTMRVVGQTWIRWDGDSWTDYSTGEQAPDPPARVPDGVPDGVPESPEHERRRVLLGHTARNVVLAILALCVLGVAGLAALGTPLAQRLLAEKFRNPALTQAEAETSAAPTPTSTRARPLRDCAGVPKGPRADLHNCRLANEQLVAINLTGVDFSGADLSGASLWLSNLTTANLSNTNLTGANLTYTNLTGANMLGANLTEAFLNHANLSDANLPGVICDHTTWTNGEIVLVGPECPSWGR